jgi:hypothetical protein
MQNNIILLSPWLQIIKERLHKCLVVEVVPSVEGVLVYVFHVFEGAEGFAVRFKKILEEEFC